MQISLKRKLRIKKQILGVPNIYKTRDMTLTSGQIERELIKQRNQIVIDDYSTCYYCDSKGLKESDLFCPNCAFPQGGTQVEMQKFLLEVLRKKNLFKDKKKAIKKARNILFILAGLNFVFAIIFGLLKTDTNLTIFFSCLIGAIIYFALGMWSQIQPFPAILSGFFVYIVTQVLSAIADPTTIYQGLLWKVIIISGFVYGYKGVKDSQKLEKELDAINVAKDLTLEN